MPGRFNSAYDQYALPKRRKSWTPMKVFALVVALIVLIALVFVAWSLLGPALFHTGPSPLPIVNPAPAHPAKHW